MFSWLKLKRRKMKTNSITNFLFLLFVALLLGGCKKDIFEPTNEDFKVKAFISNIKSYNVNSEYDENKMPVDTTSADKPYVSVQSWVIKGKDILMSITVPDDAEELYFGAINSQAEYMGLNFEGQAQNQATGYYRLKLSSISNPDTAANGLRNYQVVLSSNENIQIDKFDLLVSCKTTKGISNKASVPVNVASIAPYQKNLKVGFRPLTGYTYTIKVSTPSGAQITYSYNKNTGTENFNNSQVPNTSLSYDSGLDFKWIDFSDPAFGGYSMTATIQIDLTGGSQYIYLYLAIITEGKIDQVSLDADIQQTGQYTAVGTANVGFNYFDEYQNPLPTITIMKARMTSSHILGVDAIVWFPKIDPPDDGHKYIQLSGNINGITVIETIDVTNLVDPGEESIIEWVYSNPKLQIDLSNAKGVNGERVEIFRFNDNMTFELSAKAFSEKSGVSTSSIKQVTILLPTLIIHGVTVELLEDIFYFVPYTNLQSYLVDHGYDVDPTWYKTLWGPPEIKYSSQEDTPEEIAGKLDNWINAALNATYADKINLIGHSLGGMIGRYYITEHDNGNHVKRLILVGSPNKGSTQFYKKLYENTPQWAEAKLHTSDGFPNCRGWLSSTYNTLYNSETGELIANTHLNLFYAGNYDTPPPPGVMYFNIYNNNLQTMKTIFIKPTNDGWYNYVGIKDYSVGDVTVISESSMTYGVNIGVNTTSTHAMLPSDTQIMPIIFNSLNDSD